MVKSVNYALAHLFVLSVEMAETYEAHLISPVGPTPIKVEKQFNQVSLKKAMPSGPRGGVVCVSSCGAPGVGSFSLD